MPGFWSVITSEAGTNLVVNPSFETNATGYAARVTSSISRVVGAAHFGSSVLQVNVNGTNNLEGVDYPVSLSTSTTYTFSVYVYAPGGILLTLGVYSVPTSITWAVANFTGIGAWQRQQVTFTTGASGSYLLQVYTNGIQTTIFYLDAVQLEQKAYATTYIDGDQEGCVWNGVRHASTSTRSSQTRAGGKIVNFDTLNFQVIDWSGWGLPPQIDAVTPYGQLDGQLWQSTHAGPRVGLLKGWINGSSYADLGTKRRALLDALKRQAVTPPQPVLLRYTGGTTELEIAVRYSAGLEGNPWNPADGFASEEATIRFIADDPYWRPVGTSSISLPVNETVANANYIIERQTNGTWQALGGGLSGVPSNVYYGADGNLYVCGTFVTAYNGPGLTNPVTVNNVAMWNGSTWASLNGGTNNTVYALAFDAAGNIYAGGTFTTVNGATATAANNLAVWNGSAWSVVGSATAGPGAGSIVYALVIGLDGTLYIGGNFVNWNAITSATNLVKWTGSAYALVGAGNSSGTTYALAVARNGDLYAGGAWTTQGGVAANYIARWNGSAWSALGSGGPASFVTALGIGPDGMVYAGGAFATPTAGIMRWNGGAWYALGVGLSGSHSVNWIEFDTDNALLAGGDFVVNGQTWNDKISRWNGSAWTPLPVDLPGAAVVNAIAVDKIANSGSYGKLALGYTTSGTATVSNISVTTVTTAGTADVAPKMAIFGPGLLESIVNWTTGKALYFNLTLQAGEYAILDTQPGKVFFGSNWRGNLFAGGALLPASDLTTWRLQPGVNTVLVKMAGTITASTAIYLLWRDRFVSNDV